MSSKLPPVKHSIEVPVSPVEAFRIFTDAIDSWWPLATHSVDSSKVTGCVFEGEHGGRIFETHDNGSLHLWGTVTIWNPPEAVVFSWHPGRPTETAQEIELRFVARGTGTIVELEQRGWEALGDRAAEAREGYRTGWPPVLSRYAECCASHAAGSNPADAS
jgi:uncharacterized protein YndB with AHSA1/START domain